MTEKLEKIIFKNTTNLEVYKDEEFAQVSIGFKFFGIDTYICYQNEDGIPEWNNDGANSGYIDCLEILENHQEFKHLNNDQLSDLLDNLCLRLAKKYKVFQWMEKINAKLQEEEEETRIKNQDLINYYKELNELFS